MKLLINAVGIVLLAFVALLLGFSEGYEDGSDRVKKLQIDAIINECAHWEADQTFMWNEPKYILGGMEDEIQK